MVEVRALTPHTISESKTEKSVSSSSSPPHNFDFFKKKLRFTKKMQQNVAARAPMDPKVAVEVEKYRDLQTRT